MRQNSTMGFLLVAVLFLGAGCSGDPTAPKLPATPRVFSAVVPVQLHGVLHVPPPRSSGVQGRVEPWLTADDGTAYDLVLGPGLEPLSDPASSGRGVTITGDVTMQFPAAVGAEPLELRVTAFSFD